MDQLTQEQMVEKLAAAVWKDQWNRNGEAAKEEIMKLYNEGLIAANLKLMPRDQDCCREQYRACVKLLVTLYL